MDFQATSPLLMLSVEEETSFISLKNEKRVQKFESGPKEFKSSMCVGSSRGWLILLDESSEPYLLNPFDQTQIQLPKKITFPHISSVTSKWRDAGEYLMVAYSSGILRLFEPWEDKSPLLSIKKAVLSANPSTDKDFVVVVIYGQKSRIAYCRNGDQEWSEIGDRDSGPYCDIACSDGSLFALGGKASIEIWDLMFSGSTLKKKGTTTQPPYPRKLLESMKHFPGDLYATKWYIVPCKSGDIFFVVRYVGEFVTCDGKVVYEEAICEDLRTDDQYPHPIICPYKTMNFHVYRLDTGTTTSTWEEVKSLNDLALFLGGNHSVSILASDHSECKADSIYFTDDYWGRINEDYLYGGHDMGVFSLKDESVQQFLDIDLQKITPPPFWLIP